MRKLEHLLNPPKAMVVESDHYREQVSKNIALLFSERKRLKSGEIEGVDFKFPGYSNKNNKVKIRSLAYGCCGYCGLRIDTSSEVVEHYRPKNRLEFKKNDLIPHIQDNTKSTPINLGYFKWGSDYRNLLPSCACCNGGQGNHGVYIAEKDSDDNIIPGYLNRNILFGKFCYFPIFRTNRRDRREGALYVNNYANEQPLLFDPYVDDQLTLFAYRLKPFVSNAHDEQGIKIIPNKNLKGYERKKAIASINLLGLNRASLCHARFNKYNVFLLIEQKALNILESDIDNFTEWLILIGDIVNQFDRRTSELISFAEYIYSKLVFILIDNFNLTFPSQSLGQANSFDEVINSFSTLVKTSDLKKKVNERANRTSERLHKFNLRS